MTKSNKVGVIYCLFNSYTVEDIEMWQNKEIIHLGTETHTHSTGLSFNLQFLFVAGQWTLKYMQVFPSCNTT